jgi:hypothetical protein
MQKYKILRKYGFRKQTRVIKSRRITWEGHVARMGKMRNSFKILVGKPERTRPRGRPELRWEDNIGMDLREIKWKDVDWIHVAQNTDEWRTLVNTVMDHQVPENF